MILDEAHKPYVNAVKRILEGKAVRDLEGIRQRCNQTYYEAHNIPEYQRGHTWYTSGMILLVFVADAENDILRGADPVKAYGGFKNLEPERFRKIGRELLEDVARGKLQK